MYSKSIFLIALTCATTVFAQNGANEDNYSLKDVCVAVPSLVIRNRTRRLECCEIIQKRLFSHWSNQEAYLTRTLATLKAWNCPQFDVACSNRYLGFTEYTSLVYDRFCNESRLIEKCESVVIEATSAIDVHDNETSGNWTSLAKKLQPSRLSSEQLTKSCIQMALYDSENGGWENYFEIISFIVPYCNSVWCGFDRDTIIKEGISPWKCLPARCKTNVIMLMGVFIALAILVVFANFSVLLVYSTEKKLRHSQGIFRLSLGIADITTGLIVFPAATYTIWKLYQEPVQLGTPFNITGEQRHLSENGTDIYVNATVPIYRLESRVLAVRRTFPRAYLDSIGFFTTLSLTVSIYLLTVSGIDRLQAIARPMQYRQHSAKRFTIVSSIICWVLAFFISALPTFLNNNSDLYYILTGSGLITLTGTSALILYAVGFFMPLLATWIISIAMFVQGKKSFIRRASMSTVRQKHIDQQRRLNFILSLMVTAFSLSMLPTILVLILVLFIPGTDPRFIRSYKPLFNNIANSMEATAVIVLMSNSLWNCLIYSLRTKTFRKTALEKYKSIWNTMNPLNVWNLMKRVCSNHKEHYFENRQSSKSIDSACKTRTSRLESAVLSSPKDSANDSPVTSKKFRYRNPSLLNNGSRKLVQNSQC